jgi:hypothetical protein
MAEKVTVELVDDLDGSVADETIRFTWDNRPLVIDLTKKNADKLRKAIDPFVAAARPDEAPAPAPARRGRPVASTGKRQPTAYPNEFTDNRHLFNEWLGENGEKPARGRVSTAKANAFAEAIRGGWSPKK